MSVSLSRFAVFALAVLGLGAAAAPARANLLTNGSFEAVDASAPPYFVRSFASTPGWTQFADGVDLIHDSYTQGLAVLLDPSDGVQFLDMNQLGRLGGLFQVVAATPGAAYRLELDTAAWGTNAIGGTLGYEVYDPATNAVLASGSYTDNVGGVWIARSLDAVATSNQIGVRIQALFSTEAGPGLDNVRLTEFGPAAVPEPASAALLAVGAAGLLGVARRRRAAATN